MPVRLNALLGLALLAMLASGCGSGGSGGRSTTARSTSASALAPIHEPHSPSIDPANFVDTINNRFWPLVLGTGFHYEGTRGKVAQTDDELAAHQTIQILGIRCTVVRDTVSEHGRAIERTLDFYAQDKQGNVWCHSPLEPQTEEKYYVAGIGEILERVVKGHHEEFRLVRVTH
jgi:hypothetical protein